MGFRDRLADLIRPSMQAGTVEVGMDSSRFLGPSSPIDPRAGWSVTPRSQDFTTGYNVAARPRSHERISFETLRGLIDAYDVAQVCIDHRINDVRSLSYAVKPAPWFEGDAENAVRRGREWLAYPDGETPFRTWLAKYLNDVLRYDAGCLYRVRNRLGRPLGLKVIDGTTIAPLLDYYGNTPRPPAPAFVQYVQGLPWDWLTIADLIYVPFNPQSNSPYGRAPIEKVLLTANTDLRFQTFFLQHFTEGTVPEGLAISPESWTPDQISQFQDAWDALLAGDQAIKSQIKWVPGGTKFEWPKSDTFDNEMAKWLERKTCAAYGVQPQDIGIVEDVNRATGEVQADIQARVGNQPLANHMQDIIDRFLQKDLGLPVIFEFDTDIEKEDRVAEAQANEIYWRIGVLGADEIRTDLGREIDPDNPVPRGVYSERGGFIPVGALQTSAGIIDPRTDAPDTTADAAGAHIVALPRGEERFSKSEKTAEYSTTHAPLGVEGLWHHEGLQLPAYIQNVARGLIENGHDRSEAIEIAIGTVRRWARGGGHVHPEVVAASQKAIAEWEALKASHGHVGKGSGVGIDADTGLYGSPMLDDDDELEERAKFTRFAKARLRERRWRDFTFEMVDPVTAHRLNDTGRATVRKACGGIIAAGLCVLAADTGRVLMLQRGLDPDDPAAGKWEMPGGHVETGEDPLTAATREWCEETGCLLPLDGELAGGWTGSNGIYEGFIYRIPAEAQLPIHDGRDCVANPDDPDGDLVESIAWWDPQDLPGNPVVRGELGDDIELVLSALAPDEVVKAADAWHDHPIRRVLDATVDFHADRVVGALERTFPAGDVRELARGFVAENPGTRST